MTKLVMVALRDERYQITENRVADAWVRNGVLWLLYRDGSKTGFPLDTIRQFTITPEEK